MNDLISRSALRAELTIGAEYLDEDTLLTVINTLDCAPTVDAEPVRHGRWKLDVSPYTNRWLYKCTACNSFAEYETDYCPNCGAKMDEENDNGSAKN